MATDIVQSLFGLDPYQTQMQQQDALRQQAAAYANMAPQQRAAMSLYQAGGQLAGAGAEGLFGMVNPAVAKAQATEQAMMGLDMSNPQSILAKAQVTTDPRLRIQLQLLAQQAAERQQAAALKAAQTLAELKKATTDASPIAKLNPKDYTPESWAAYIKSGSTADLRAVPDAAKTPSSVAEYEYAKTGGYKGSYEQWVKDKARAGATSINMPAQEKGFDTELGKLQAKRVIEGAAAAEDAQALINTVTEGEKLLNAGIKSGVFANFKLGMGKALKGIGIDYGDTEIANTEAFAANMAQNVGRIIKQFGSGTGLSDADRQYAERMAGGQITLDENSIRKILAINKKQANWVIAKQRALASGVKTNLPLAPAVEPPAPSETTMPSPTGLKGKTIRDTVTGARYTSDGTKWVKQ